MKNWSVDSVNTIEVSAAGNFIVNFFDCLRVKFPFWKKNKKKTAFSTKKIWVNKSVLQFEPQEIEPQIIVFSTSFLLYLFTRIFITFSLEVSSRLVHTVYRKYKWIGWMWIIKYLNFCSSESKQGSIRTTLLRVLV